jgi:hypothetical protein
VTDAAKENLDGNILGSRFAALDGGGREGGGGRLGGKGFGLHVGSLGNIGAKLRLKG